MKGIHDDNRFTENRFTEDGPGKGRFQRGRGRRGPHGHGGGFGPGGFGPGGFGPGGFGPGGYGLIKTIAEKTSGTWRPSPGSVYPTLQQLVDEELIAAVGEGRRTEFTLTEDGRAYVAEHAEELANAWNTDPHGSGTAFHHSVGKLMGVIHQFRVAATEEQRQAAIEKMDETRRALYLILAD
jgi:DNA-binding PadR family transcriptional regulator